jgi:hypothetical protein
MRFTVTFEGGVFTFLVESLNADETFVEEFELIDVNEAKETVWELIDEISAPASDADADFVDDLFKDDGE